MLETLGLVLYIALAYVAGYLLGMILAEAVGPYISMVMSHG